MKRQHRQTLQALDAHPLPHGLRWSRVEALLLSLGAWVEPLADHRLQVHLPTGERLVLHGISDQRHGTLDLQAVQRLRQLLHQAGIRVDHPPLEANHQAAGPPVEPHHRLVIRLDHRGAQLWHLRGACLEQAELHPHGLWGSDQNLSHRHERDLAGQRAPLDHAYLEQLSAAIAAADAVLLLGHGHGQADGCSLLTGHLHRHHRGLLERIVGVVRLDDSALSDGELLALAREQFGELPARQPLRIPGQAL